MTIRKRGSGYAVEVYDPSRKSRKRYVGTFAKEKDARAAARTAEAEIARLRGRRKEGETVQSWADRWLALHPRQKPATNRAYAEQIRPFAAEHGSRRLREIDVELAVEWVRDHRWTLGGVRAMFSDARRNGLVDTNPFTNLRLRGTHGRRDLDVLAQADVDRLAGCALEVWDGHVAPMVRALVLAAAYVGMRPAELYGLRWGDIDLRADEVHVRRQYDSKAREFVKPKNGRDRLIVLTAPAKAALLDLPRPLDGDELVFKAARGGPMTGRVQHYYWHPVRCRFGRPSMDFYELRHFCASWLFNDLELPAQDVAHQLGHTDGGALVQRLYGHPSERLARDRIKRAMGGRPTELRPVSEAERRQVR